MGRVAWADAHARRRLRRPKDVDVFDDLILGPLQGDLLEHVWLGERYGGGGGGQSIRTPFFFEYPAVVAMLLHEVRYGVDLGIKNVTVAPLGPKARAFVYALGDVSVAYSSGAVAVAAPGACAAGKRYSLQGLPAGASFNVTVAGGGAHAGSAPAGLQTVDATGTLAFELGPANAAGVAAAAQEMGMGGWGAGIGGLATGPPGAFQPARSFAYAALPPGDGCSVTALA